jgi:uncharacterized protein with HEPN domain
VKRDPRVYLAHILECAERIEQYTRGGKEAFLCDTMIQDAVIRNFEVISEAAKTIPEDYRNRYTDIPWKLMAGFRDVLIHDYEGVDIKQVWKITNEDLPKVKAALSQILPPLDQLERELAGEADGDEESQL